MSFLVVPLRAHVLSNLVSQWLLTLFTMKNSSTKKANTSQEKMENSRSTMKSYKSLLKFTRKMKKRNYL